MPLHLPHGFDGRQPPTPSHLKQSLSVADILPTAEQALKVTTMADVRKAIDTLDREIVTLLGTRLRFIEAAARIKEDRAKVRDEWRKKDVLDKAVKRAGEVGMDENILKGVYEALVEGCIEYEGVRWDEYRKPHQKVPEVVLDE
ncbi:chorismate mutase [Tirmania nivea]|nr:chorismate mutase [Tirmania nivea]